MDGGGGLGRKLEAPVRFHSLPPHPTLHHDQWRGWLPGRQPRGCALLREHGTPGWHYPWQCFAPLFACRPGETKPCHAVDVPTLCSSPGISRLLRLYLSSQSSWTERQLLLLVRQHRVSRRRASAVWQSHVSRMRFFPTSASSLTRLPHFERLVASIDVSLRPTPLV